MNKAHGRRALVAILVACTGFGVTAVALESGLESGAATTRAIVAGPPWGTPPPASAGQT